MNAHQRRIERRSVARFKDEFASLFNRWPHWTERAVEPRTVQVEFAGNTYRVKLDERGEPDSVKVLIRPDNARNHWREIPYKKDVWNQVAKLVRRMK